MMRRLGRRHSFTAGSYCRELIGTVEALERKNYMAEVTAAPGFEEGRFTHDLLRTANKVMLEEIAL